MVSQIEKGYVQTVAMFTSISLCTRGIVPGNELGQHF